MSAGPIETDVVDDTAKYHRDYELITRMLSSPAWTDVVLPRFERERATRLNTLLSAKTPESAWEALRQLRQWDEFTQWFEARRGALKAGFKRETMRR